MSRHTKMLKTRERPHLSHIYKRTRRGHYRNFGAHRYVQHTQRSIPDFPLWLGRSVWTYRVFGSGKRRVAVEHMYRVYDYEIE